MLPHFSTCLSSDCQEQTSYIVVEVIVYFVDIVDHHCLNFTFIFVWGGLFGHELSKFKDILIQNMLNCNKDNDKTTIKYHETVTIKRTTNKQWLDGKTGSLILYLISLKVKQKGPFNCF